MSNGFRWGPCAFRIWGELDAKSTMGLLKNLLQIFTDRYIGGADPYLQVLRRAWTSHRREPSQRYSTRMR